MYGEQLAEYALFIVDGTLPPPLGFRYVTIFRKISALVESL